MANKKKKVASKIKNVAGAKRRGSRKSRSKIKTR
tara:strand:+ start:191 stop:292 length:102 start_codon:yes stop_codon:yes gene_type:complete